MRRQQSMSLAICAVAAILATGLPAATLEMEDRAAADSAVVRDAHGMSDVKAQPTAMRQSMPMWFEAAPAEATPAFRARGTGYTVRVLPASVELRWQEKFHSDDLAITLTFLGASPQAYLEPVGSSTGRAHYYVGNDASQWRAAVPMYQQVQSRNVYPGIDAIFYGNDRRLEYDFIVSPGVDPAAITLAVEGPDHLQVDTSGNLVMRLADRELTQPKPFIYQQVGDTRHEIEGGWALQGGGRVGFGVGAYDRSRPLVIDPVVMYSTYLGGSDFRVRARRRDRRSRQHVRHRPYRVARLSGGRRSRF